MFCQKIVGLSHLGRAAPTIVRVLTIAASSAAPTSMAMFLKTIQDAGMTIASSGLGQGSH